MCHFVSFNLVITEKGWDVRTCPSMDAHHKIEQFPGERCAEGEWMAGWTSPDIRFDYLKTPNIARAFYDRFPTRDHLIEYFFKNYPECHETLKARGYRFSATRDPNALAIRGPEHRDWVKVTQPAQPEIDKDWYISPPEMTLTEFGIVQRNQRSAVPSWQEVAKAVSAELAKSMNPDRPISTAPDPQTWPGHKKYGMYTSDAEIEKLHEAEMRMRFPTDPEPEPFWVPKISAEVRMQEFEEALQIAMANIQEMAKVMTLATGNLTAQTAAFGELAEMRIQMDNLKSKMAELEKQQVLSGSGLAEELFGREVGEGAEIVPPTPPIKLSK